MGDVDSFKDAWDVVYSAFLGSDLDDYAMEFVTDQLMRAGMGPVAAAKLDSDDVVEKLCRLSYTDKQRSWIYNTEEKINDDAYIEHMTDKDD